MNNRCVLGIYVLTSQEMRDIAGLLDAKDAECRAWRDWYDKCGAMPFEACECEDVPRGKNLESARRRCDELDVGKVSIPRGADLTRG